MDHTERYRKLTEYGKEAVKIYRKGKINSYELADRLNMEYQQVGAFVLSNGLSRKIERS